MLLFKNFIIMKTVGLLLAGLESLTLRSQSCDLLTEIAYIFSRTSTPGKIMTTFNNYNFNIDAQIHN